MKEPLGIRTERTSTLSAGLMAPGGTSGKMVPLSPSPIAPAEGSKDSFPPSGPTDYDWMPKGIQQRSTRAASAPRGECVCVCEQWSPPTPALHCSLHTHPSLQLSLAPWEDQTLLQLAQRGPAWLGRRRHKSPLGGW